MKFPPSDKPAPQRQTDRLLTYWRTSLADEDILGGRDENGDLHRIDPSALATGELDLDLSGELRRQWKTTLDNSKSERTSPDFDNEQEPTSVPVVILSKGLSPEHLHASVVGDRKRSINFGVVVPAFLGSDNKLRPDPENLPWIRREFLAPTASDSEEIPVVGTMHDFDDWLDRHPASVANWTGLMEWLDSMWDAVSRGCPPEGFVEIDDMRIYASKAMRGMGRHILKLYDALLAGKDEHPKLLTRACDGQRAEAFGRCQRLRQIDAPKGYMGAVFGLTSRQADAATAMTLVAEGQLLAVNGPPGTGKTTLLQSVIATETVSRALAGGEPAVIVGCSTNNQAVTNINRAMNRVLTENRSGETFAWARRWVPDVPTYGLYLPSSHRADEAEANGFSVAVQKGTGNWTGFPEREADPVYVDRALSSWLAGFKDAYGYNVAGPEDGLGRLQADLHRLLAQARGVGDMVRRWDDLEEWWRDQAGEKEPKEFIAYEMALSRARAAAAAATLKARVREAKTVRTTQDDAVSGDRRNHSEAEKQVAAVSERLVVATYLQSRIEAAGAPRGFFELALSLLPITRRFAMARQHSRRLEVLKLEEKILFQVQLDNRDGSAWRRRADDIVTSVKQDLLRAQTMCNEMKTKWHNAASERKHTVSAAAHTVWRAWRAFKNERATGQRKLELWNQRLNDLYSVRIGVKAVYDALRARPASQYTDDEAAADIPDWLAITERALDVSIRHEMFQKAMRYWEGRWIIEAQKLCRDPSLRSKNGHDPALDRLRRWCMLTPCLISTLHSLPNRVRFSRYITYDENEGRVFAQDFLREGIDLLIMDEAGQVGPHVGMAAFALARRALVVGDVYQLEPVMKIPAGTDRANALKCGLADTWGEDGPISPLLLGESHASG